jgi:hypothetical protein
LVGSYKGEITDWVLILFLALGQEDRDFLGGAGTGITARQDNSNEKKFRLPLKMGWSRTGIRIYIKLEVVSALQMTRS